ncbi:hypothetical protein EV424DRAFT_1350856 [Suillus variegatus]|nr:hypothetical protein EV424DRAFT_1350856 [Suillus variegatus]
MTEPKCKVLKTNPALQQKTATSSKRRRIDESADGAVIIVKKPGMGALAKHGVPVPPASKGSMLSNLTDVEELEEPRPSHADSPIIRPDDWSDNNAVATTKWPSQRLHSTTCVRWIKEDWPCVVQLGWKIGEKLALAPNLLSVITTITPQGIRNFCLFVEADRTATPLITIVLAVAVRPIQVRIRPSVVTEGQVLAKKKAAAASKATAKKKEPHGCKQAKPAAPSTSRVHSQRSALIAESELDQVKQKSRTTEDTIAYLSDKVGMYRHRWLKEYYQAENLEHHMLCEVYIPDLPQITEGIPSLGFSPEFLEWEEQNYGEHT